MDVVESIVIKPCATGCDAIVKKYSFFGGLVDQSGTTPRFTQAEESLPYFASDGSTEGYIVHRFLNDMGDSTGQFYDPAVVDSLDTLPILGDLDESRWGIPRGGYRLDGQEYMTFSYSVDDTIETFHRDTSWYHYSLSPTPDSLHQVFRTTLDSVIRRDDDLTYRTFYAYDTLNGLVNKVEQKLYDTSSTIVVEESEYAYDSDSSMLADNALVQVAKHTRYVVSPPTGEDSVQSVQVTEYEKQGDWQPVKALTFRDLSGPSDTLITFQALSGDNGFDDYGNLIGSMGANNDTSCVKVSANGIQAVASATNCHPEEWLYQGFEEGDEWDGWNLGLNQYCSLDSEEALTGTYSYKLEKNVRSVDKVWGAIGLIESPELNSSGLYHFSFWAKYNDIVAVYLTPYDSAGVPCGSDGDWTYAVKAWWTPDTTRWQRIEGGFDLKCLIVRDTARNVIDCVDYVHVQLIASNDTTGLPITAYFDDFRFHPIDAQVTSSTYDPVTGIATSNSDHNNIPTRYTYDKHHRLSEVRDFEDNLLTTKKYHYARLAENFYGYKYNYTQTTSYRASGDSVRTLTFTDGLGRTVQQRADWVDGDVAVKAQTYDAMGRISRDYKPFIDPVCHEYDSLWTYLSVEHFLNSDSGSPAKAREVEDTVILYSNTKKVAYYLDLMSLGWNDYCVIKRNGETIDSLSSYFLPEGGGGGRTIPPTPIPIYQWTFGEFYTDGGDTLIFVLDNETDYYQDTVTYTNAHIGQAFWYVDTIDVDCIVQVDYGDLETEASAYYSDTGDGTNCNGYPYSEPVYSSGTRSRLEEVAGPGDKWNLGSGHTTQYEQETLPSNGGIYLSSTTDPDGVVSESRNHKFGRKSKSIQYYGNDTVTVISNSDLQGRTLTIAVDTAQGPSAIALDSSFYTDLGLVSKSWRRDYGYISMLYDKAGNLRFMQNDKRHDDSNFVYFKYDALGRKIEEGVMGDSIANFTQAKADDQDFPDSSDAPDVAYRWYYDSYDTVATPGHLVRVENCYSTYYRQFFYYPNQLADLVVTKLPIDSGSLKAVRHDYYSDGSLKQLTVFPYYPDSTGMRIIEYGYNDAGQLSTVTRGVAGLNPMDTLTYADLAYNVDGSMRTMVLGKFDAPLSSIHDTAQKVDYYYDPRGMLSGINETQLDIDSSNVIPSRFGGVSGGNERDHFGAFLEYFDDTSGYYNGRVNRIAGRNSSDTGIISHQYDYTFDDLVV